MSEDLVRSRDEQAQNWGVTRRQVSKIRAGRLTLEEAKAVNTLMGRAHPWTYPQAIQPPINTRDHGIPSWHFGHFAYLG